jgi:hypothetical protein
VCVCNPPTLLKHLTILSCLALLTPLFVRNLLVLSTLLILAIMSDLPTLLDMLSFLTLRTLMNLVILSASLTVTTLCILQTSLACVSSVCHTHTHTQHTYTHSGLFHMRRRARYFYRGPSAHCRHHCRWCGHDHRQGAFLPQEGLSRAEYTQENCPCFRHRSMPTCQ